MPARKQIVVIDDDATTLRVLCKMLETIGHSCTGLSDPEAALRFIEREHESIDLVLTDYTMPVISGLQIVLFCAEKYPRIPVVVCSGLEDPLERASKPASCPTARTLQKPFRLSVLNDLLTDIFS